MMLEYSVERDLIRDSNLNYDRKAAKEYAEKYALRPNVKKYAYLVNDDSTNFISQVLKEGSMEEEGTDPTEMDSWFCNTNDENDISKISMTWISQYYFKKYWGNYEGKGRNRAFATAKITAKEALDNFVRLYFLLKEGDIIQYGDCSNKGLPYHIQVIHDKGYNWEINKYDIFMAQHTPNRLYVSWYTYLKKLALKGKYCIYIYKIRDD